MAIDNSSCKTAIENMKSAIAECFQVCRLKNSTYTPTAETLANSQLFNAIGAIPSGSGGGYTSIGQSFSGFDVTAPNLTSLVIDCGSIGADWRAITIYSSTKEGWFTIYKISSNICIMSANPWYAIKDDPVLEDGNFPYAIESSSFRCLYTISGNTITINAESYLGQDSSVDISVCGSQVSKDSTYMLDTIDIIA